MHDRQDQSAAVEHHPLTTQSGTDKRDLFGRTLVQTRHRRPDDEQRDQNRANQQGKGR